MRNQALYFYCIKLLPPLDSPIIYTSTIKWVIDYADIDKEQALSALL